MKSRWVSLSAGWLVILLTSALMAQGEKYVFLENFDGASPPALPVGWTMLNANADSQTWETVNFGGARGGPCVRYLSHPANTADDWFFTPAIALAASTQYTLSFESRVTSPANPHHLSVWVGTSPTTAAMTTQILDRPSLSNREMATTTGTLTTGAAGSYSIGFHCTSNPNQLALYVDNVVLSVPATDLQIRFQLDKAFYQAGANTFSSTEPIKCLVYVKNVTTSPLTVNSLLSLGHDGDPEVVLSFLATAPGGAPLEFRQRYRLPLPAPADIKALQPGEAAYKYYDLKGGAFNFTTTGTYTIRAVYKNLNKSAGPPVWLGRLVSDPVQIRIP